MLAVGLVGCGYNKDDNGEGANYGVNTMVVNGCQYVLYNGIEKCAMVHAGNCNNPIHKSTQQ